MGVLNAVEHIFKETAMHARAQVTKKVTADKEGGGPHCQGLLLKERWRLSLEYFTFCLRTLKLTDTLEVVRVVRRWHRMEERQRHMMTNPESESERSLREP